MSLKIFTRYLSLLTRYLKPQWLSTLSMALLLLIGIGLQLLNPRILGTFMDATVAHGLSPLLIWLALSFLVISMLKQTVSVVSAYLCEKVAWTATNLLRTDLLTHILTLDMAFHKSHTPGELIERIDGDVNVLSNFFSKFIVHMLFHIFLLLGMLVTLAFINWALGLIMGLYCLLIVVGLIWMRRPSPALWVVANQASADFFGFLGESLAGIEDVRPNGGMSYIWRQFYRRFQDWFTTTSRAGWAGGAPWIISRALFTLGSVLGLVIGAYLWSLGLVSPGTVSMIFVYSTLLMQPLDQIQWQLQDLQQAEACIQRIELLFETKSALCDGRGALPAAGALSVVFERVSFGYSDGSTIIHNVSFNLSAGRLLGIVGRTGAGKTTLARLLFRMYDPQSGVIQLGGVPLTEMRVQELRKRIALITQDVQLFDATVRDNVTFFDSSLSDERILSILEEIGLLSWYEALPQGLETKIGINGAGISAGEAQLLALARAFLTNPDLVILDEASSRLDPLTENLLEQGMEKLFMGRTGIVIAHRLATLQRMSDIMVVEDGCILEFGPRIELMANPESHFARLLQHDLGGVLA